MTAEIASQIIKLVAPMLKYECENCEDIVCIYSNFVVFELCFFIFYSKINSEKRKELDEQIDNYVWGYIEHYLNYEKYLPRDLIRKIRNIIGYDMPMIQFEFAKHIPKNLMKEIEEIINKKIPSIRVRHFPIELKGILPSMAKLVAKK